MLFSATFLVKDELIEPRVSLKEFDEKSSFTCANTNDLIVGVIQVNGEVLAVEMNGLVAYRGFIDSPFGTFTQADDLFCQPLLTTFESIDFHALIEPLAALAPWMNIIDELNDDEFGGRIIDEDPSIPTITIPKGN